jgi:hypothetical protein
MLVQLIFRRGSGVTPDSGKTVLRSRLVRKTAGTCPARGCWREAAPAEIIFQGVRYTMRDLPATGISCLFLTAAAPEEHPGLLRNKSVFLWELRGESSGIPHLPKPRQIWGTRRLVKGPEPKSVFLPPPLASGQSSAQKRDLGHPLMAAGPDMWHPARSARSSAAHICQNRASNPNFLYAALERTACAPFSKERRMKFREPTKLHRKSGIWGTRRLVKGIGPNAHSLDSSLAAGKSGQRYSSAKMRPAAHRFRLIFSTASVAANGG